MPQDTISASHPFPDQSDKDRVWDATRQFRSLHESSRQNARERKDNTVSMAVSVEAALTGLAIMDKIPGNTGLVLGGAFTACGLSGMAWKSHAFASTANKAMEICAAIAAAPSTRFLSSHGIHLAKSIRQGMRRATISGVIEGTGSFCATVGVLGLVAAPTVLEKSALLAAGTIGFLAGKAVANRVHRSSQANVEVDFSGAQDIILGRTPDKKKSTKLAYERRGLRPPAQLAHS